MLLAASFGQSTCVRRPLTRREVGIVEPQKLLAVKALQSLQDPVPDSAAADGADHLAFEVESVASNLGNVPVIGDDLLVGGDLVSDQCQDGHDDMLGDTDDVGAGNFGDGNLVLVGRIQIDMITANAGSDAKLELRGLLDQVGREIARVEGGGDENLGLRSIHPSARFFIRTHIG